MPISIPTEQIKDLQQIEVVVSGPDGANRLYVLTGALDLIPVVSVSSSGPVTGANNGAWIHGLAFQVTILGEL